VLLNITSVFLHHPQEPEEENKGDDDEMGEGEAATNEAALAEDDFFDGADGAFIYVYTICTYTYIYK